MNIYQDLFNILHTYIYGGVTLTSDMNLTLTLISTLACLFVVSIPFIIVFRIIKFLT